MRSLCRHSLALAAVVSVSVALPTVQPASAADRATDRISAQEVTKPAPVRHRVVHVSRRAVYRAAAIYDRALAPVVRDDTCSSVWCGRQFVLMLGIGY